MIAVLTCAGRPGGVSYLDKTLSDIDSSATGSRVIVCDRCSAAPRKGWASIDVTARPAHAGDRENRWALWTALRFAAEAEEDLIVVEDDVVFCKNGARHAERLRVPSDVAFVSLFAPWGDMTMPLGLWRSRCHTFIYAQALKFPLRTIRELVPTWRPDEDTHKGGSDDMLSLIGVKRNWLYAAHYPSIVQHVGAVSSVSSMPIVGCRASRAYRGDDFDAERLPLQMYD